MRAKRKKEKNFCRRVGEGGGLRLRLRKSSMFLWGQISFFTNFRCYSNRKSYDRVRRGGGK